MQSSKATEPDGCDIPLDTGLIRHFFDEWTIYENKQPVNKMSDLDRVTAYLPKEPIVFREKVIRPYVVQVPFEVFALQLISQNESGSDLLLISDSFGL